MTKVGLHFQARGAFSGFRELVSRRAKRLGLDSSQFLQCDLPADLQKRLDEVLDAASREQRSRIDEVPGLVTSPAPGTTSEALQGSQGPPEGAS